MAYDMEWIDGIKDLRKWTNAFSGIALVIVATMNGFGCGRSSIAPDMFSDLEWQSHQYLVH